MSALAEPPRDENGVAILPGYRPPFKKGFDPRRNHTKSSITSSTKRQALASAAKLASTPLELVAKLSSLKKAHNRCIAASVASTSGREAAYWMRAAKDALEQLQSLLGPNSTKNHSLQKLAPIVPIAPISPIAPVSPKVAENTPSSLPQDASCQGGQVDGMVKPVATPLNPIESTKIESQSDDDCPF